MTNKDQSKYLYDRSEDGALTTEPPPIDVDALKREVIKANQDVNFTLFSDHIKWAIDHLASAGYLRAPLPRIEGLAKVIEDAEWSFRTAEGDETYAVKYSDLFALIKAARAYLKLQGGEHD